ncbi:creatininase family protein [Zunongwangia pacifica]|uniref:Creatininase family protein n=1 Tax=Zunongwangia pacifica TaxID=2911062 RepID=A0A9X1ZPQ2_9FLAO|nr:creatininase family protein [Zunongwangia pacifica]MCL6217015.1 creatininase family protein [Zunongwangia pacifica]
MEYIRNNSKVKWMELLPDEFLERQNNCPLVYLPMGLCEPHGHISAFGLDTIKAEYICEVAAQEAGGIIAPTQGYHIHETGYHAPWLEEVVGEVNPYMASIPPNILLHLFLYQLRAFNNAGFKAVIVISGHAGGNQEDLRLVASTFMEHYNMKVEIRADPELVKEKYEGDHAGKYEISQLMYIRPDLIDMSKISRQFKDETLGRFALGTDASEASPELGKKIINSCINETCRIAGNLIRSIDKKAPVKTIDFEQIEELWKKIAREQRDWTTWNLHKGQNPAGEGSRWKKYERWVPSL